MTSSLTLIQIVDHPKCVTYLANNRVWRTVGKLSAVFSDILSDLTNFSHDGSKLCEAYKVAYVFLKKLSMAPYNRKNYNYFKESNLSWLISVTINGDSCQKVKEMEKEVQEVGEEDDDEEQDCGCDGEDEDGPKEPPRKKRRKERKSYSDCGCSSQYKIQNWILDNIKKDPKLHAAYEVQEEEQIKAEDDYFDEHLSCFNCICSVNLSMNDSLFRTSSIGGETS